MIAALFVDAKGVYSNLPGVDAWGMDRDARKYTGPHPVVVHPPCSAWCQLAYINQKRYAKPVGVDGGCFEWALFSVIALGGVLEHPAYSYAWPRYNLPKPKRGCWISDGTGWATEVSQSAYGHRARKRTWLYYVGKVAPPLLNWSEPEPTAQVSWCKNHGNSSLPRLGKKEAQRTPIAFRDLLLSIARNSRIPTAGINAGAVSWAPAATVNDLVPAGAKSPPSAAAGH